MSALSVLLSSCLGVYLSVLCTCVCPFVPVPMSVSLLSVICTFLCSCFPGVLFCVLLFCVSSVLCSSFPVLGLCRRCLQSSFGCPCSFVPVPVLSCPVLAFPVSVLPVVFVFVLCLFFSLGPAVYLVLSCLSCYIL